MGEIYTRLIATGSYLPERIISNHELTQFPQACIKLIEEKTGIKTRRIAEQAECTSDLGIQAAYRCLEKRRMRASDLDAIILSTSSPDRIQPATATRIQSTIGAINAFAFDINSVCSGGIYGIGIADSFIKSGFCNTVLVIAADLYSRFLNPEDFSTFPYFGDGAGAVLLEASPDKKDGIIIKTILMADGSGADVIQVPAGGTKLPFNLITESKDVFFKMKGKRVYAFAIEKGSEIISMLMSQTGSSKEEIKYIVAHQANINILREISSLTGIDFDKFVVTVDKYGNTASASTLIALDEISRPGNCSHGDKIIMVAFGGGLSWAATLIEY